MTRLRWLSTGPVEASPAAVKAEVAKLEFLRELGADSLDLSVLPAERRRFLATVGRRLTAQALERRDPERRYPILLTVLAQSATDVLDEVVQLFDQAISARESKAERTMRDALAERGKTGEDRQALLDDLLAIITDTGVPDEQIGGLIRGDRIGWHGCVRRWRKPLRGCRAIMGISRRWTAPRVLAAVHPAGAVRRRDRRDRAARRGGDPADTQRHRRPLCPRRCSGRVRARAVARISGDRGEVRQQQRVPALLGAVHAAGVARRAAHRRRVRAGLASLLRPGRLPAHAGQVGIAARGVLPAGRQTRRPDPRAGRGRGRAGRGARRAGGGPGRRGRSGAPGRGR